MAAVRNLFPTHVISKYGDIKWPARLPYLSTCGFFLWGYLKFQVFKAPAPHTVQDLKHRIQEEVKGIPVEKLLRVIGDVRKRLAECLERNCGHPNDVISGSRTFVFNVLNVKRGEVSVPYGIYVKVYI